MPGNTTGADPGTAVAIDSVGSTSGNTVANTDGAIAIGYDGTTQPVRLAQIALQLVQTVSQMAISQSHLGQQLQLQVTLLRQSDGVLKLLEKVLSH